MLGLSTYLCKWDTVIEMDREVLQDGGPVFHRSRPFGLDVSQRQIEQLDHRLVIGERSPVLDDLSQAPIEGFDGIGRIDGIADLRRIGQEEGQPVPAGLPGLADLGITAVPRPGEGLQGGLSGLHRRGSVDLLQIVKESLAVFKRDVLQGLPDHVDDGQLDLDLRVERFNGLRETRQPVHAGQEDILDPPVLELGQHLEPKLGPLGLFDPKAQNFLEAMEIHPDGQIVT